MSEPDKGIEASKATLRREGKAYKSSGPWLLGFVVAMAAAGGAAALGASTVVWGALAAVAFVLLVVSNFKHSKAGGTVPTTYGS